MEKGEIRFHGPTAELLERPDLLRSVFLEGAAAAAATEAGPRQRDVASDGAPATAPRPTAASEWSCSRSATSPSASAASRAVDDVSLRAARRRDPRAHRAERRRQDDDVRPHLGLPRARRRAHRCSRAATSPSLGPDRACPARARPFVPGRAAVPVLTVRRDARASRSSASSTCATPSPAALHLPTACRLRGRASPHGRRARRADGARRRSATSSCRELSTGSRRIVDLACMLAHEPDGDPARRAVVAASPSARPRRSVRCSAHPRRDGREPARHRARHAAHHVGLRPHRRHGPRRVVVDGDAETVLNHPHVVASYLGSTREAIERSGTQSTRSSTRRQGGSADEHHLRGHRTDAERSPWPSGRWIRGFIAKYKKSYQVARGRHCSGRCSGVKRSGSSGGCSSSTC